MPDHLTELKEIDAFKSLSDGELRQLLPLLIRRDTNQTELLITHGKEDRSIFFVAAGRIKCFEVNDHKEEILLEFVEKGGVFGEVAAMYDGIRSADARTEDYSVVYMLPGDQLTALDAYPSVLKAIMREMARRLRRSGDQLRFSGRNPNEEVKRKRNLMDRMVLGVARFFANPIVLIIIALLCAVWMGWNIYCGQKAFDKPPFGWLSFVLTAAAFFFAGLVLRSQHIESKDQENRTNAEFQNAQLRDSSLRRELAELRIALSHPTTALVNPHTAVPTPSVSSPSQHQPQHTQSNQIGPAGP